MALKHVVVSEYGTFLSKKSERLVVRKDGRVSAEVPFFQIEQVTLEGRGIALSADLIQELSQLGIQINFLTNSGRPYAKLSSPSLSATVDIRRAQLSAYNDRRGVLLIRKIIAGKLANQINLLRYFAKYRKKRNTDIYNKITVLIEEMQKLAAVLPVGGKKETVDDLRDGFLGIEARVGRIYWRGVKILIADKIEFQSREHQGAIDPVNSALNYGYGWLYNQVWSAVVLAGLEPFAGFLHTDRPGKPSLVLDLVEEFRQPVVDRLIVARINKGQEIVVEDGRLTDECRRSLAQELKAEFDRKIKFEGKMQRVGNIIQMQARAAAVFLRDKGKYRPFVMKW